MEEYDEELAALVRKNVALLSEIQEDLSELQRADAVGVVGAPVGGVGVGGWEESRVPSRSAHHHASVVRRPSAGSRV